MHCLSLVTESIRVALPVISSTLYTEQTFRTDFSYWDGCLQWATRFTSIIFTACIRSTREGTVFTGVCMLTFRGGYPIQVWMVEGYPIPGVGGTQPGLHDGGYPIWGSTLARSSWWGYLVLPWLGLDGGGYPGYPHPGMAYPWPGMGYPPPSRPGWGTPPPWNWATPRPGMGYPQHYQDLAGVPPWMEYPPHLGWGTPPRQSSIASTCYAAGGMPLAFTQEDLLVIPWNIQVKCTQEQRP